MIRKSTLQQLRDLSNRITPKAPAPAQPEETDMVKKKPRPKVRKKDAPVAEQKVIRPGSKLETVAKLLTRANGCTTKDVLDATGWPTVSMPQQAKAAGLVLKTEKDGRVTRYRGEPAQAA